MFPARAGIPDGIESTAAASFPPEPLSAPAARRFVADVARRWRLPDLRTIVLLADELATNAILHGRTDFEVCVTRAGDTARVEVHDGNTRAPVASLVPEDATTGRGLLMVQLLASRWGIESTAHGKAVWFEVPATVDVRTGLAR